MGLPFWFGLLAVVMAQSWLKQHGDAA